MAKTTKSTTKAAAKKVMKLKSKPAAKKNGKGSSLPKMSTKPYGKDGKALTGVRILDFTHVQSGPTCT